MVDYKNQEIANKIKPFTENICVTIQSLTFLKRFLDKKA